MVLCGTTSFLRNSDAADFRDGAVVHILRPSPSGHVGEASDGSGDAVPAARWGQVEGMSGLPSSPSRSAASRSPCSRRSVTPPLGDNWSPVAPPATPCESDAVVTAGDSTCSRRSVTPLLGANLSPATPPATPCESDSANTETSLPLTRGWQSTTPLLSDSWPSAPPPAASCESDAGGSVIPWLSPLACKSATIKSPWDLNQSDSESTADERPWDLNRSDTEDEEPVAAAAIARPKAQQADPPAQRTGATAARLPIHYVQPEFDPKWLAQHLCVDTLREAKRARSALRAATAMQQVGVLQAMATWAADFDTAYQFLMHRDERGMLTLKLSAMSKAMRQAAADADVLSIPLLRRRESHVEYAKLQQAMPRVYRFAPRACTLLGDAEGELRKAIFRRYDAIQEALPNVYPGYPVLRDMPSDIEVTGLYRTVTGFDHGFNGLYRLTWRWPQSLANVRAFEEALREPRGGLKKIPLRALPSEPDVSNVPQHSLWSPPPRR